MGDNLRTNGSQVAALGSAIMGGAEALGYVPGLLKIVLDDESWRRFITPRGDLVEHQRFADFATAPPLHGIGADIPLIKRIIQDDPVTLDLLDQALKGRPGNPTGANQYSGTLDNIQGSATQEAPTGTSAEAGLRRLRSQAPELHARVLAGEMSPHAAMVEAGFRKRMISIPVEDAERAARSIRANASPEFIRALMDALATVEEAP
jgi:hypothetical protein